MNPPPAPEQLLESVETCILCGSTASSLWVQAPCPEWPHERFEIVQCAGCGLRRLSPRPTPQSLGSYYGEDYYSYQFSGVRPRSHRLKVALWRKLGMLPVDPAGGKRSLAGRLARALATSFLGIRAVWTLPAPAPGQRFLDLGCGAGERLELARELGWETYGVDLGEAAVAAAAARGHRTAAADAQHLPFASGSFDYLNLGHVLEHAANPLSVLQECRRLLRPGGTIQVDVPNADSWGARHFGGNWRALDVPRHLYHFTPATLARLIRQAGLRVATLRTLPNQVILEQSRQLAGLSGRLTRWQRLACNCRARLGQGEYLDVWCTAASTGRESE